MAREDFSRGFCAENVLEGLTVNIEIYQHSRISRHDSFRRNPSQVVRKDEASQIRGSTPPLQRL